MIDYRVYCAIDKVEEMQTKIESLKRTIQEIIDHEPKDNFPIPPTMEQDNNNLHKSC